MLIYNEEHLKHILKFIMLIISCNMQIYYMLIIFFFIKIKGETLSTLCVSKYIPWFVCHRPVSSVYNVGSVYRTAILECLLFKAY